MLSEIKAYTEILQSRFEQLQDVISEVGSDYELLNWRPVAREQPSIFGLIAHVALNTDYWIGHVIGGRAEPPGFDNALDEASGDDPQILLQLLDSAQETARLTVKDLTQAQLTQNIDYADEVFTARQCILQVLDETASRCGEIEVLRRWYQATRG